MNLLYLKNRIEPLRKELIAHPVYSEISSMEDLCAFYRRTRFLRCGIL